LYIGQPVGAYWEEDEEESFTATEMASIPAAVSNAEIAPEDLRVRTTQNHMFAPAKGGRTSLKTTV